MAVDLRDFLHGELLAPDLRTDEARITLGCDSVSEHGMLCALSGYRASDGANETSQTRLARRRLKGAPDMVVCRSENLDRIDALLEQAGRLHSAPAIALKIVEITRDPDFEISEVVTCLEHDPALAGSILRLLNSSHFGLAHQVSSIQQGVAYLGRRALRLAAISFGIVKNLARDTPGELYALYWKRSLTMACAARLCAKRIKADSDEAFAGGLFADLGMLVLAQVHANEYVHLAIANENSDKLLEAEQDCYGFDHAAVTARLLEQWRLPEELIQATASHHQLSRFGPPLSQLIYVANLFAEVLWTPKSPHMQSLRPLLADLFECDIDDLVDLALGCRQAVNQSAEIFQVQMAGEIDVDAVQREASRQFQSVAMEVALDLDSLESVVGLGEGTSEPGCAESGQTW